MQMLLQWNQCKIVEEWPKYKIMKKIAILLLLLLSIYIYIYKTKAFEAPTIFHVSTIIIIIIIIIIKLF